MFSCDYNGWADMPEEEREGIDAFEFASTASFTPIPVAVLIEGRLLQVQEVPQRRAA